MSDFLYNDVVKQYLDLRRQVESIDEEAKRQKALLRTEMSKLEAAITKHAQDDGLVTVPTMHGTVYWSTHYSCTCANRDALFDYVREHEAWDLLESRPSKSAVKSLVEATGAPPPGVNFSGYRVLNIRENRSN